MIKFLDLINNFVKNNFGKANPDLIKRYPEVKNYDLDKVEIERFDNDLEIVYNRLIKGEYKLNDFSGKNKFNIPQRTKEFFIYLESYCIVGRTWQKLFENIDIHSYDKICNLCPGWAPKIELALYYSDYKGTLEILDKDDESITQITKFMNLFQYPFKIEKKHLDIFLDNIDSYGLVIANHVIDDIILDFYSKKTGWDVSMIYKEEKALIDTWAQIIKNGDEAIEEFIDRFTKVIIKIVKPGGIFILSQYKSYIEYVLDLDISNKLCHDTMLKIKQRLIQNGFTAHDLLTQKALNDFEGYFNADETCFLIKK